MSNHSIVRVENTKASELSFIYQLFDQSVIYQEKHGYPVWRNYDKDAILRDIENQNQYKVIVDLEIGIVFSVAYTDKVIWRERDKGDAVYLHRIVVNPNCKGRKLFGVVLEWAKKHIHEKGLSTIRMDTWATNSSIINYYKTFGFVVVENYTTPNTTELPVHNRNLALTLLEFKTE